jgi:hypothetical protein
MGLTLPCVTMKSRSRLSGISSSRFATLVKPNPHPNNFYDVLLKLTVRMFVFPLSGMPPEFGLHPLVFKEFYVYMTPYIVHLYLPDIILRHSRCLVNLLVEKEFVIFGLGDRRYEQFYLACLSYL